MREKKSAIEPEEKKRRWYRDKEVNQKEEGKCVCEREGDRGRTIDRKRNREGDRKKETRKKDRQKKKKIKRGEREWNEGRQTEKER